MSGGQPAIRGYLVQTLIALLDALRDDRPWEQVRLEPADPEFEKIDLLWEHGTRRRAVQVKSSQNQIGKADAERWAGELEANHGGADELELVLVGPCAESVVQLGRAGRVTIPPPVPLNLGLLCQAAAHRLALFLESQGASAGRADQREALVRQLGWRLAQWSAESHRLSRAELAGLLEAWSREEAAKLPLFPIFTAPQRNPFFTGREAELEWLHTRLRTAGRAVLSQTQAISGLGGVGKTQTVLEYAHQYRGDYDAVFWISAASELELRTEYAQIAARLGLPHDAGDAEGAMRAARRWLESSPDRRWLLVFDNADDPQVLKVLQGWLPSGSPSGHMLVTSRARVLEALGLVSPLALATLPAAESTAFLLKRTGREQAGAGEVTGAAELARELDGLPLALEQAAAYVLDRDVPFAEYLASYRRQRLALLEQRGPQSGGVSADGGHDVVVELPAGGRGIGRGGRVAAAERVSGGRGDSVRVAGGRAWGAGPDVGVGAGGGRVLVGVRAAPAAGAFFVGAGRSLGADVQRASVGAGSDQGAVVGGLPAGVGRAGRVRSERGVSVAGL